ncbi:MAG TPA: TonB-dependent receptor, partial [Paracoccaceae bacterium]|nr:TonB-dependent receptor [Paracoccaceae bacterium]
AYTGYRLPTLNELYRPFVIFPLVTQANAQLDTEKLRGAEIGLDAQPASAITLSATLFWNELRDAIANVTLGENLRQRRNLDAIEVRGAELSAAADLGAFDLRASYAYNDARVSASGAARALDGFRPSQSPVHSLSATLGVEPAPDTRLSATLRHVGAQYEDDREQNRLPPATTLDLFAEAPIAGGFSLVARAENLLDERIVTRDTGAAIDLGTPRTLWLGLRYSG